MILTIKQYDAEIAGLIACACALACSDLNPALFSVQSHDAPGLLSAGTARAEELLLCRCTCIAHLQPLQGPIALLKIDTEGHERCVLQGLTALLEARQVGAAAHDTCNNAVALLHAFTPFLLRKVLNIVAELKPPHRSEIINTLKAYGFKCMKYTEAYELVMPSDAPLEFSEGRLIIDRHYYGISCDETHPSSAALNQAEVRPLADSLLLAGNLCTHAPLVSPPSRICRTIGLFFTMQLIAFGAAEAVKRLRFQSRAVRLSNRSRSV